MGGKKSRRRTSESIPEHAGTLQCSKTLPQAPSPVEIELLPSAGGPNSPQGKPAAFQSQGDSCKGRCVWSRSPGDPAQRWQGWSLTVMVTLPAKREHRAGRPRPRGCSLTREVLRVVAAWVAQAGHLPDQPPAARAVTRRSGEIPQFPSPWEPEEEPVMRWGLRGIRMWALRLIRADS